MGHHCLKAALKKPLHELAGGDAKGAAFVADVLQHSTSTTRNHNCPERNKCSSTAQSQALLHLGNHCRSPILTLAASTTKSLTSEEQSGLAAGCTTTRNLRSDTFCGSAIFLVFLWGLYTHGRTG